MHATMIRRAESNSADDFVTGRPGGHACQTSRPEGPWAYESNSLRAARNRILHVIHEVDHRGRQVATDNVDYRAEQRTHKQCLPALPGVTVLYCPSVTGGAALPGDTVTQGNCRTGSTPPCPALHAHSIRFLARRVGEFEGKILRTTTLHGQCFTAVHETNQAVHIPN